MGVDVAVLKTLLEDYNERGAFGDLLQLGRQGIYIQDRDRGIADDLVRSSGLGASLAEITGGHAWADEHLFTRLGARTCLASDASTYEGAKLVHDFNDPIALEWHQRFDVVIDSGTSEHIFNIPTAFANMMKMLRIGGRLITVAGANNFLGHGFYQLSPEFAYRVFSQDNGFKVLSLFLTDPDNPMDTQAIPDPAAIGSRNEIGRTKSRTYMISIARKLMHMEPFARWPQQSDYLNVWTK